MSTIREIMKPNPIAVRPEDSLQHALELLIAHSISGMPVVDESHAIVGVLSEKDVLKVFYETNSHNVGSIMTRNPMSFAVETPLVDVVDCLMANDFRRVLIHEKGKLVGLISRADLMPSILQALLLRLNQRPD